jgi:hypothetical protein
VMMNRGRRINDRLISQSYPPELLNGSSWRIKA